MNDKTGRNAPCPCGSGKKFKKCCGFGIPRETEELFSPLPDELLTGTKLDFYFEIFQVVAHYAEMLKQGPEFGAALRRLCRDFEKRFKPGEQCGLTDSFYMNWFTLDNRFGVDQRTVVERFMDDREFQAMPENIREGLRRLSGSYAACYELKAVRPEELRFEELATGRQWTVRRLNDLLEPGEPGDIWYVRFVGPRDDAYYFGQPFVFGPEVKSGFIKIVKKQISLFKEYASTRSLQFEIPRDAFKAAADFWAEYLYRSNPAVMTGPDEDSEDPVGKPVVQTTDGEKIRLTSVVFKIITGAGLQEKLARIRNFVYDSDGQFWVWLKKGNRGMGSLKNTVLGRVYIQGDQLIGETNSLERALRLKNKIAIGLGKMAGFDRIDSADVHAMPPLSDDQRRKFDEEQKRMNADPEIRKVIGQHLEQYYLNDWIAAKIPALENKTPLQAVKTKNGRLQLEALINRMEAMDQALPYDPPKFDMNFLRKKLGLPLRRAAPGK